MHDPEKLGFSLIPDFITAEEEALLVARFGAPIPKKQTRVKNGIKGRNSIRRYGSSAPYGGDMASKTIPDYLHDLSKKIFDAGLLPGIPDSVTINEYLPGQGIAPHIDSKASGPVVTVLSLLSPATMYFSRAKFSKDDIEIELPPRCLIQMRKEIREHWQHGVKPVAEKRFSIVFRCSK